MAFTQSRESEFIRKLTEIVAANLTNEQFGVSYLAREMGMSRSNLHRKVKLYTGLSVSRFIRQIRLKKAFELLTQTSSTISEVAFKCGFQSVSYFDRCFRDHYGYPPGKAGKEEEEEPDINVVQYHDIKPRLRSRRKFIVIGSTLIVIIISVVIYFIFRPILKQDQNLDKSIAVLPFIDDSPDKDADHIINGTMEEILNNLCKIKDLRVPGRLSVEPYRNNPKPIPEIAKDLRVSYILEGSGQKYGDNIRLSIQLIDAVNDRHIWSRTYDREISDIEELFKLQSEIAQLVAKEIKVNVTPEEQQRMEKIPLANPTAYDFYQRGIDEHYKYWVENNWRALERAEELYKTALEYDSLCAPAYTGLALIYFDTHYWDTYFTDHFLDSMLTLVNIALSLDDQLTEAYLLRGVYYRQRGNTNQALKEYNIALDINPNNWKVYHLLGALNYYYDLAKAIDYKQKAASLDPGIKLPVLLKQLSWLYTSAGFPEKARFHIREALKLDSDSSDYYNALGYIEYYFGNLEKAIELLERVNTIDTNRADLKLLGESYLLNGQYEASIRIFRKMIEKSEVSQSPINNLTWIAYAFWRNGYQKESEKYLNKQIDLCKREIELGRGGKESVLDNYYTLAAVYAFRGEKDRAIENLNLFKQKQIIGFWWVFYIKNDPLFDSMRDEPEFQQIVRDMELTYQTEHEKVRNWLQEQGML